MDGREKPLKRSLRRQLLQYLAVGILMTAGVAGALSYHLALHEAHELQDDVLRQTAALLHERVVSQRTELLPRSAESEELAHIIVEPMTLQDGLGVPAAMPDGLYTKVLGSGEFRVLISTQANGQRMVVAQPASNRKAMARHSALTTLTPLLLLSPLLLLLVSRRISKAMLPIAELAREVDSRPEASLKALPHAGIADEVVPFVAAINRLIARTAQALAEQRRFIADAAHEMRTPLTAMSLQAERLALADMSQEAAARLQTLRQGIARNQQLLDQMLALARQQAVPVEEAGIVPVALREICLSVMESLMPLSDARGIDLGLVDECDAFVAAPRQALLTLVGNLADNAIRYTPPGGQVDLRIKADALQAKLWITDSGPGIAPAERQRVFDPFYRVLGNGESGSGLGLAIVMNTVQQIGAEIHLDYADAVRKRGLQVCLTFPAPVPSHSRSPIRRH